MSDDGEGKVTAPEGRAGILDSVSDWLKLLALVVLVTEAVILLAMRMTPETNPLTPWYPILMLLFLSLVVIGLFTDRYLQTRFGGAVRPAMPGAPSNVHDGTDIGGGWSGHRIDRDARYNFSLNIIQRGKDLSGYFEAVDEYTDGVTKAKRYRIRGEISSNHALITFENEDRKSWGGGSFLLKVFDSGNLLKGAMSYIKTTTGDIGAKDDIVLTRKS